MLTTHLGRRLQPFCSSGRTARTVTVPPVTGVLIRLVFGWDSDKPGVQRVGL
jgi:hypothetical protein